MGPWYLHIRVIGPFWASCAPSSSGGMPVAQKQKSGVLAQVHKNTCLCGNSEHLLLGNIHEECLARSLIVFLCFFYWLTHDLWPQFPVHISAVVCAIQPCRMMLDICCTDLLCGIRSCSRGQRPGHHMAIDYRECHRGLGKTATSSERRSLLPVGWREGWVRQASVGLDYLALWEVISCCASATEWEIAIQLLANVAGTTAPG